jgi:hypothetical protein
MSDTPYRSRPEHIGDGAGPASTSPTDDVGRRARDLRGAHDDRPIPDPHGRDDRSGVAHAEAARADAARSADDPLEGRELALRIDDPRLRAETLIDVARGADDPRTGRDIALGIDPDVRDAAGTMLQDRGLSEVARSAGDPLVGRDVALGINDADLRAHTLADVAGRTPDPLVARDIAHAIDTQVTDSTGTPLRDLTLADIAGRARDPQLARDVAHSIADDGLRTSALAEVDQRVPRAG